MSTTQHGAITRSEITERKTRPFRLFYADRCSGQSWQHAFASAERRDFVAARKREDGLFVAAWDLVPLG